MKQLGYIVYAIIIFAVLVLAAYKFIMWVLEPTTPK